MTTLFTHAFVGGSLVYFANEKNRTLKNYIIASLIAAAPDLDVLSFRLGIEYGSLFGHRGITHSILFALALGIFGFLISNNFKSKELLKNINMLLFFILAALSHGILDALTNGGHGVAFFAPFNDTRYFLPVHPIDVCKIGMNFFHSIPKLLMVMKSEFLYVWLPFLILMTSTFFIRYSQRLETAGNVGFPPLRE